MRYCGDWLFWVNICRQGEVFESGKFLNYFRRHINNVSSSATRDGLDFLEGNEIYEYVLRNCSPNPDQIKNAGRARLAYYNGLRDQYSPETDKTVRDSLRKIGLKPPSAFRRIRSNVFRRAWPLIKGRL